MDDVSNCDTVPASVHISRNHACSEGLPGLILLLLPSEEQELLESGNQKPAADVEAAYNPTHMSSLFFLSYHGAPSACRMVTTMPRMRRWRSRTSCLERKGAA